MKYQVKNWNRYQHYKDRNPTWIKLYIDTLQSRDWVMLDDKTRVLFIAIILLAPRSGGEIDGSPEGLEYLKKAGSLSATPSLEKLISCGFLVASDVDSETLAPCASGSSLLSSHKSKTFKVPKLEEVRAYCAERGGRVDPEKWLAYYQSNGWRVGRNPMKDWKAAVRTWEKSEFNQAPKSEIGAQEFVA